MNIDKKCERYDIEMIFKMYDIGLFFRLFLYLFYLSFIFIIIFCRFLMKFIKYMVKGVFIFILSVWKFKNVLYFL